MRIAILLALVALLATTTPLAGAAESVVRASLSFGPVEHPVAVADRPIEIGVRGPVQAFGATNVAVAGLPVEPSSKGPVGQFVVTVR